jgi:metallo-beta-lactamase class B
MNLRPVRRAVWAATLAVLATTAHAQAAEGCHPGPEIGAAFDEFARGGGMAPVAARWLMSPEDQKVAPFKAFDDAYFVGVCWVSAWLLPTPQGHFLIDTLHEPHAALLLDNIRKLGFDPQDIRYVLITHGHFDHAGGAARLKKALPNARFVMTETGWNEALASAQASTGKPNAWEMIAKDIVAKDGDVFTLGGRTVTVYETPGHTLGTASFVYDVHDGARTYSAVTVGGLGLNAIQNAHQVELYIDSMDRLRRMATSRVPPVTVHLTTHPFATDLMAARPKLAARTPGDVNPLVDGPGLIKTLDGLEKGAQDRLVIERAKQ